MSGEKDWAKKVVKPVNVKVLQHWHTSGVKIHLRRWKIEQHLSTGSLMAIRLCFFYVMFYVVYVSPEQESRTILAVKKASVWNRGCTRLTDCASSWRTRERLKEYKPSLGHFPIFLWLLLLYEQTHKVDQWFFFFFFFYPRTNSKGYQKHCDIKLLTVTALPPACPRSHLKQSLFLNVVSKTDYWAS